MASRHSSPPRGAFALALGVTLGGGSGCASAHLGTVHPEACTRLGSVSAEGIARTEPRAAEQARAELRNAAGRQGANYVELMFETKEPPPLLSPNRSAAHAGGVAWRCPALPEGAD